MQSVAQGWLATATWDPSLGRAGPAHLYHTRDGGHTLDEMAVDMKVGTVKMLMEMPLNVSYFLTMFWADASNGHLGGSAYVADQGSGGGSSTPPIEKNVDFVTRDGGATWTKTDLGAIDVMASMGGGGGTVATDGRVMAGQMLSFFQGFMVGETGAVYSYDFTCIKNSDCGAGYECHKEDLQCHRVATTTGDATGGSDVPTVTNAGDILSTSCTPDTVACDGNRQMVCGEARTWAFLKNCATDGGTCLGGECHSPSSGGCSASGAPAPSGWLALGGVLLLFAAFRGVFRRA